jgi:putative spermidine/putrescine transport system permease protein
MTVLNAPAAATSAPEPVGEAPVRRVHPVAWLILIGIALYFFVPLILTFWWSLRAVKDVLGFEAYGRLFADPNFWAALGETVMDSLATIALSILIIVPTAFWVTLRLPKLRTAVEFVTLLPFVIPPVVLVLGILRLYARPPLLLTATYGSSRIVLICIYAAISFPYMYRSVDTGLRAIDVRSLTEAAQTLGAGWATILRRVILPNIRAAVLSGSLLTFAIVFGEYAIAVFMAQHTFGPFMANLSRSKVYEPAAMTIVAVAIVWIAMAIFVYVTRPRNRR